MPNSPATAPPLEPLRNELSALVGDEVVRLLSRLPGNSLEESPNRGRGRQRTINCESHQSPGEVVDGNREPPAKWPNLRQGEGNPRGPEAERGGHCCQSTCQRWFGSLRHVGPPAELSGARANACPVASVGPSSA